MKKIISILLIAGMAMTAAAVPARRDGMVRTAADGTEKTVFLHGNEFFHYMTDEEGNWLDEETLLPLSEDTKEALVRHEAAQREVRRARESVGVSPLLAPRGIVILANYNDKAFQATNTLEAMTEWAMGENYTYNGATGSIHQYFYDQSWGQYDLQIDVVGPVTVSRNAAYYGANSTWGNDQHADELVKEACLLADSLGADFSQYDSNGDGKVDWVVILYAGKGEASGGTANTIWPHQSDLSSWGSSITLDGKKVDHYCCLNELSSNGKRSGIGTFCHEFGHIMGLPDFYATNSATHKTLGEWDIMDYGPYNNNGNTPPAYSAYERWWMGWFNPTLLNEAVSIELPMLNTTKAACYITENGSAISNVNNPSPSTFYLLENRQKIGWDKYIPGHGLLITKIKFSSSKWTGNTVNNTKSSMGVDIVEADGSAPDYSYTNSAYFGKAGDAYPAGATTFTKASNYQVTDIAEANQIITFNVNGGSEEPVILDVRPVNDGAATATKIIRDGQVLIIRNGVMYNLQGAVVK